MTMKRNLLLGALCLHAMAQPQASNVSAQDWTALRTWAGKRIPSGFTPEQLTAFLAARQREVQAGARPPWSTWLLDLSEQGERDLKAWALTRRVEAGDFRAILDLERTAGKHILNLSKPFRGDDAERVQDPPSPRRMGATFRMDPRSPYHRALEGTIRESPTREVSPGTYHVWCYNTRPEQRDLVLEIARHLTPRATQRSPQRDPWNDPRMWILADWLAAWGREADLEAASSGIQELGASKRFKFYALSLQDKNDHFKRSNPWRVPGAHIPEDDQAPERFRPMAPSQGDHARQMRIVTQVTGRLHVDAQGEVTYVALDPGPWLGLFTQASLQYGYAWKFAPRSGTGPFSRAFTIAYAMDIN